MDPSPYPVPPAPVDPYPVPTSVGAQVGVDGGPVYHSLEVTQPAGGGLLLAAGCVAVVLLWIQARLGLRLR